MWPAEPQIFIIWLFTEILLTPGIEGGLGWGGDGKNGRLCCVLIRGQRRYKKTKREASRALGCPSSKILQQKQRDPCLSPSSERAECRLQGGEALRHGRVVQSMNSGARLPGSESQLCDQEQIT